ncbi:MAG: hypothetical protein GY865_14355, partial [candidate division Zixibacteria bacterium]|nr:hypothetical protein [candidate division Zixibacteria bacterium]
TVDYEEYAFGEVRFKALKNSMPDRADKLAKMAAKFNHRRYWTYKQMASLDYTDLAKK